MAVIAQMLRRYLLTSVGAMALLLAAQVMQSAHAQVDPVPGSLDTTFALGNGKIPALSFVTPGNGDDRVRTVAVQPDNKIVMVGLCSGSMLCMARLNPDGTLDDTFDGPFAPGNGQIVFGAAAFSGNVGAALVQPDGKLLVAGTCNNNFCMVRLNGATGGWDSSFTGPAGTANGTFSFPIGAANDEATAVALLPDGRIVVAGMCSNGSNNDFCAARLLANGALDTTFAGTGTALIAVGVAGDRANAVAVQRDGKIVLAGYCNNGANVDFCIVRLNNNGTLDNSFNGNGKLIVAASGNESINAMVIQPDDRILVAGDCGGLFCAARFNADGDFDGTFNGPNGNAGGFFTEAIGSFSSKAFALAVQPDGKFILAGECEVASGGTRDFCLARYVADGSRDRTFDGPDTVTPGNGEFLIPIRTTSGQDYDDASSLAIQRDGKIVVAGSCGSSTIRDFCVARLHGGPFNARQCSMDIDGDGAVIATVDSLIHARVALGITGNAVVSGITFAPHALRPSWASIRNYLITQCGMTIP